MLAYKDLKPNAYGRTGLDEMKAPHRVSSGPLLLALLGAGSTVAWAWDISWHATLPGEAEFPIPRLLAVVGCLTWAVVISLSKKPSKGTGLVSGVSGLLAALAWIAVCGLWRETGSAGGYLTPSTLFLSLAIGFLAIISLHVQLSRSPTSDGGTFPSILQGGLLLFWLFLLTFDYVAWPNLWRGPSFLMVACGAAGFPLALMARGHSSRWSAAATSLVYATLVGFTGIVLYLLPPSRFSGQPTSGHFMLLPGPILIVFSGIALDWAEANLKLAPTLLGDTLRAGFMGTALVGTMWMTHRLGAELFLMPEGPGRELADLWWPAHGADGDWRFQFWALVPGNRRWVFGTAYALVLATVSIRLGLSLGPYLSDHSPKSEKESKQWFQISSS